MIEGSNVSFLTTSQLARRIPHANKGGQVTIGLIRTEISTPLSEGAKKLLAVRRVYDPLSSNNLREISA